MTGVTPLAASTDNPKNAPLSALDLVARELPAERLVTLAAGLDDEQSRTARHLFKCALGRMPADMAYSIVIGAARPQVFAEADAIFGVDVKNVDEALLAAIGSAHEVIFQTVFNRLIARVKDHNVEDLLKQAVLLIQPARFALLAAALEPKLNNASGVLEKAKFGKNPEMIRLAEELNRQIDAREDLAA